MSEEERREYEAYQESLRYQASMFESTYKVGEMKGLKQGIEIGRKEGQKDKALEMELPLIEKVSGLSQDEIMNL